MRYFAITAVLCLSISALSVTKASAQDDPTRVSASTTNPTGWQKFVGLFERGPHREYGYHGHRYEPHRIKRDLNRAAADFAPTNPKTPFHGNILVMIDRYSGGDRKITRGQRYRRFKKNNNFSGNPEFVMAQRRRRD